MNYQVTVNGQIFNVSVQPNEGGAVMQPVAPAAVAPAPVVAPQPVVQQPVAQPPVVQQPAAPAAAETQVLCPMPGNIWAVEVAPGDVVTAGQVLVVLEAMKMENDIVAPRDGVVKQVLVTKGATVEIDNVLVVLS